MASDLTARPDGRPLILVAIDGSPSSLRAGAYAISLGRLQHAHLVCLYVHAPALALATVVAGADVALQEASASVAEELHGLFTTHSRTLGIPARFVERAGSPYAEIVRAATELQADSIVVGTSTQAGHRVIGAIGTRLIRAGKWPVTVVP